MLLTFVGIKTLRQLEKGKYFSIIYNYVEIWLRDHNAYHFLWNKVPIRYKNCKWSVLKMKIFDELLGTEAICYSYIELEYLFLYLYIFEYFVVRALKTNISLLLELFYTWTYSQKNLHSIPEILVHSYSLLLYTQYSVNGNSLDVHQPWTDEKNVVHTHSGNLFSYKEKNETCMRLENLFLT